VTQARSAEVIIIGGRRREKLQALLRKDTAAVREVRRAAIILAAGDGHTNARIARDAGVHVDTVRSVRARYRAGGWNTLRDRPRPGRPLIHGLRTRIAIVATATSQPPGPVTAWTHTAIAAHLAHTFQITISPSQIGRILASLDVKPHQVTGWLNRPDNPAFFEHAAAICDLYLNPPTNSVLLSIDEKTGIQAKSRKHPTRRAAPGRPARREFEYIRHGTVSLIAAMNVTTGTLQHTIITRNDSATFLSFLAEIDASTPTDLDIHLVMDNGSSHRSKATRAWLSAHPRFHIHHTPVHSSWLNMVEIWFSILTSKVLRRGEFTSREHLAQNITDFVALYNTTAKPFRWTYDARPLQAA
jgi:transposase